ncbi:MAG TPA: energy transducer TonB [Vicinamibacterales bacterium]|nr:energy transducer TonB [Vicinamibacterales bacterium]
MSVPNPPNELPTGSLGEPKAPMAGAAATGPAVVSHGWLSANSTFDHVDDRKMGRALSTSVVLHGVAVAIILFVMAIRPTVEEPVVTPEKYDLVFVQTPGPGGGGGGGGNQMKTPPAKIEMKAVVPKAPKIEPPKVDVPPPPPTLAAPVQMTAVTPLPGTMTGLAAAPSLGTGTGGGGGTGVGTGTGPGRGSGIGDGTGGGFGGGAMRPGNGVTNPTILRQLDPKYTPDAMRAKVQGVVELEAVVGTNGQITEVRILKSLDRAFGLDEEAIKTAKQWLFRPGRFQGQNVPVVVVIQMEFRLH